MQYHGAMNQSSSESDRPPAPDALADGENVEYTKSVLPAEEHEASIGVYLFAVLMVLVLVGAVSAYIYFGMVNTPAPPEQPEPVPAEVIDVPPEESGATETEPTITPEDIAQLEALERANEEQEVTEEDVAALEALKEESSANEITPEDIERLGELGGDTEIPNF